MDLCPIITLWEGIRKLAASGEKLLLGGFSERAGFGEKELPFPAQPAPASSWRFRVNTYLKRDEKLKERG